MARLISKKEQSGKKLWYIVENSTVNGKVTRKYVQRLGDCSIAEAHRFLEIYNNRADKSKTGEALFKDIYAEFLKYYKTQIGRTCQPRTFSTCVEMCRRPLQFFGYMEIRHIKFMAIEDFKKEMQKVGTLSKRTINIMLGEFRKVLKFAIEREYIQALPTIKMLTGIEQKDIDRLSKDQVSKLLESANFNQYLYICLGVYTGMRPNELLTLQWGDVDLKNQIITIRSENMKKRGRKIPISSELSRVLSGVENKTGRVSPYPNASSASREIKRLGDSVGITINSYMLRKTFVSLLAEAGVPIAETAKLVGHQNINITARYYLDINAKQLLSSVEKLSF